ncbi:MAG: glycosyltransferase family 2 protein [Elusimicrobiota bacterium]
MNSSAPSVSVLIPAHNGERWIAETLERVGAAAGGLSFEITVVDNASSDGTVEIARNAPGVRVLRNESNLGFSRAVNQAAAESTGKTLVAINQDLHLRPDALRRIHEFLSSRNAVAGGALFFPDGSKQPSHGPFPTLTGTILRLLLPRRMRKYDLFASAADGARPVDWVTGAFIGFSRELFDRIRGFDEDYFMYYEDVDFCASARRAGFPSYYLPSAQAVHVSPYSERGDAPDWLKREVRYSQTEYFRKHRPSWEYDTVLALNKLWFAARGWQWR